LFDACVTSLQTAFGSHAKANLEQENVMKTKVWTGPKIKEVCLGCGINSYTPVGI